MNPLTALLTDILATGDWQRLPILADFLEATMTSANCEQRSADAAWLRGREQKVTECPSFPGRWHLGDCLHTDVDLSTEAAAVAELFRRVTVRFGLTKVECGQCNGFGIIRIYKGHGDQDEEECPACCGRGWHLAPVERVPCQRCKQGVNPIYTAGVGKLRWHAGDGTTGVVDCPTCQGQGTVTKGPA